MPDTCSANGGLKLYRPRREFRSCAGHLLRKRRTETPEEYTNIGTPVPDTCSANGGLISRVCSVCIGGMETDALTPLAHFLLGAETVADPARLAEAWFDQTAIFRLRGAGALDRPGLGGHLRRSFLGALGRGASPEARAGQPCAWDPPCALDVFLREQFRGPGGDGLPKPYVIFTEADGPDLLVSLRVFGMANDWFAAASEAFVAGMREILPWRQFYGQDMPALGGRRLEQVAGLAPLPDPGAVRLEILSPMDASTARGALEASLLSRLLRRVDALSRWQGLALDSRQTRRLTEQLRGLDFTGTRLRFGVYNSPNRKRQNRARRSVSGHLVAVGDLHGLMPVLAIGERCHVGRGAVEGQGRYQLIC